MKARCINGPMKGVEINIDQTEIGHGRTIYIGRVPRLKVKDLKPAKLAGPADKPPQQFPYRQHVFFGLRQSIQDVHLVYEGSLEK